MIIAKQKLHNTFKIVCSSKPVTSPPTLHVYVYVHVLGILFMKGQTCEEQKDMRDRKIMQIDMSIEKKKIRQRCQPENQFLLTLNETDTLS